MFIVLILSLTLIGIGIIFFVLKNESSSLGLGVYSDSGSKTLQNTKSPDKITLGFIFTFVMLTLYTNTYITKENKNSVLSKVDLNKPIFKSIEGVNNNDVSTTRELEPTLILPNKEELKDSDNKYNVSSIIENTIDSSKVLDLSKTLGFDSNKQINEDKK
jgi:preprotein translocase subunit SecG